MDKADEQRYKELQERQHREWESKCTRCGACCGALDGDPCEHLVRMKNGRYACDIYETRFGWRRTRGGRVFRCVPIRDILHESWPGDEHCGYKQHEQEGGTDEA